MSKAKTSLPRYPRILNSTEFRILETAAQVRYGEVEDYKAMHFSRGSETWCRKVLTGLCCGGGDRQTGGYLVSLPLPSARGGRTRLYALSSRGAKLLAQNGIHATFWYRPRP
jgi:hypothetical protein